MGLEGTTDRCSGFSLRLAHCHATRRSRRDDIFANPNTRPSLPVMVLNGVDGTCAVRHGA